jgi:hypothetical protein
MRADMKIHNVNIRLPSLEKGEEINEQGWYKQTTSHINGNKTTLLFQRKEGEAPRTLVQKISDFFSGIKRARNSTTLGEAFKGIKKYNENTYQLGKFNVNLIPDAINKMAPEEPKDLLGKPKPAKEFVYKEYKLKLEGM